MYEINLLIVDNMETGIGKLQRYIYTYQKGAHVINDGFCRWLVTGTLKQQAAIAKKAILLGFAVRYKKNGQDCYESLHVGYF